MAFLAVLTADGGIPILTKTAGDIKSKLPFASIGLLNGVHMFSRLQEVELKCAVTPDEKISWREYHKRLVLILITKNDVCSDCHVSNLLDNIFAALAMLVGLDVLLKQNEVLKLQKMLVERMCQFLDVADSLYGCLLIKGKVIVASKEWWTLTSQEQILICSYVNSLPKVLSREIIIYLPTSSPQNSNRLITLHLLRDVEICVLCSSEPSLAVLEDEAPKIWRDCFDILKVVSNLHPRNFPSNIELDKNIIGLILINTETNQCMCSVQPSNDDCSAESKAIHVSEWQKKQEALRSLYRLVVGTYFKEKDSDADRRLRADNPCHTFDFGNCDYGDCKPGEFYMCTQENKCYVINEVSYQIYILYNYEIPLYAIRSVSHKTLKLLTEKRLFPTVGK
ncbi:protein fuzzy homolog isoform X4 [Stegodyphus dumicola]|uniref:protein fuzzy homolog isoform X4 n=1 Tax=Stegodyphus dumicola TaxID=202533 RepID=UPI0015ADD9BB|nr:protein fuzzy homolog isoform X4 [Stegodyphus dumicola]